MPLILTSPPAGGEDAEVVRLWLIGAEEPQVAYSPLVDSGTDTAGMPFVRAAGAGPATITVTGTWSPKYPLAAAGAALAAGTRPHEDIDLLHRWLAEGTREVAVAWRGISGRLDQIGAGVLAGGGINNRRVRRGETTIIDWAVSINMKAGFSPVWVGSRPAAPTPEPQPEPEPEDPDAGILAWSTTTFDFFYSSEAPTEITLPAATGGAPPYQYAGRPPLPWQLNPRQRLLVKGGGIPVTGEVEFVWTATDQAGDIIRATITLHQDTGM